MDNTRRFAANQRNLALDRLSSITSRAALAGFVGVVGFGGLAALNYRGTSSNADPGLATTNSLAQVQPDGGAFFPGDGTLVPGNVTDPGSPSVGSSGTSQVVPVQPPAPVSRPRRVHTSSGGS